MTIKPIQIQNPFCYKPSNLERAANYITGYKDSFCSKINYQVGFLFKERGALSKPSSLERVVNSVAKFFSKVDYQAGVMKHQKLQRIFGKSILKVPNCVIVASVALAVIGTVSGTTYYISKKIKEYRKAKADFLNELSKLAKSTDNQIANRYKDLFAKDPSAALKHLRDNLSEHRENLKKQGVLKALIEGLSQHYCRQLVNLINKDQDLIDTLNSSLSSDEKDAIFKELFEKGVGDIFLFAPTNSETIEGLDEKVIINLINSHVIKWVSLSNEAKKAYTKKIIAINKYRDELRNKFILPKAFSMPSDELTAKALTKGSNRFFSFLCKNKEVIWPANLSKATEKVYLEEIASYNYGKSYGKKIFPENFIPAYLELINGDVNHEYLLEPLLRKAKLEFWKKLPQETRINYIKEINKYNKENNGKIFLRNFMPTDPVVISYLSKESFKKDSWDTLDSEARLVYMRLYSEYGIDLPEGYLPQTKEEIKLLAPFHLKSLAEAEGIIWNELQTELQVAYVNEFQKAHVFPASFLPSDPTAIKRLDIYSAYNIANSKKHTSNHWESLSSEVQILYCNLFEILQRKAAASRKTFSYGIARCRSSEFPKNKFPSEFFPTKPEVIESLGGFNLYDIICECKKSNKIALNETAKKSYVKALLTTEEFYFYPTGRISEQENPLSYVYRISNVEKLKQEYYTSGSFLGFGGAPEKITQLKEKLEKNLNNMATYSGYIDNSTNSGYYLFDDVHQKKLKEFKKLYPSLKNYSPVDLISLFKFDPNSLKNKKALKKSFKLLAKKTHSDKQQGKKEDESFKLLKSAYDVLLEYHNNLEKLRKNQIKGRKIGGGRSTISKIYNDVVNNFSQHINYCYKKINFN